jgi:hypothetical protein
VPAQHSINLFWADSFHGSTHQQRRDLLFLVPGKFESDYRRSLT